MLFCFYTPAPPLGDFVGDFVDNLWLCADGQSHRKEKILPNGTIELILNLCDDELLEEPCSGNLLSRFVASSRSEDS
jgi:hypothetical protein